MGEVKSPLEIARILVEALQQEPAESTAGQADQRGNCDSLLHRERFGSNSCNMGTACV